jgi:hypothetical protein
MQTAGEQCSPAVCFGRVVRVVGHRHPIPPSGAWAGAPSLGTAIARLSPAVMGATVEGSSALVSGAAHIHPRSPKPGDLGHPRWVELTVRDMGNASEFGMRIRIGAHRHQFIFRRTNTSMIKIARSKNFRPTATLYLNFTCADKPLRKRSRCRLSLRPYKIPRSLTYFTGGTASSVNCSFSLRSQYAKNIAAAIVTHIMTTLNANTD